MPPPGPWIHTVLDAMEGENRTMGGGDPSPVAHNCGSKTARNDLCGNNIVEGCVPSLACRAAYDGAKDGDTPIVQLTDKAAGGRAIGSRERRGT